MGTKLRDMEMYGIMRSGDNMEIVRHMYPFCKYISMVNLTCLQYNATIGSCATYSTDCSKGQSGTTVIGADVPLILPIDVRRKRFMSLPSMPVYH